MSDPKVDAYLQALIDIGAYIPGTVANPEYAKFVEELELKEEIKDTGNWLIRVYKDHGTIFEKEFLRVHARKDGTITAAPPHNPDAEIPVGPNSVIKMFVDKLRANDPNIHRGLGKELMLRHDATESKDAKDVK